MAEEKLPQEHILRKLISMLGKKKRTLVVLGVFVVVVCLVVYFILPTVTEVRTGNIIMVNEKEVAAPMSEQTGNADDSPFSNIKIEPSEEFTEYKKSIKSGTEYWNSWVWENNLVYAQIKEVNSLNTEMLVNIGLPRFQTFSEKDTLVNVRCPKNNTVAIESRSPENEVAVVDDRGFDIFEKAEPGELFITYCLDEECVNVGKQCIIVLNKEDTPL